MTLGTKFTWSNGSSVLQLSNQLIARLPETGEALKVWNKEQFGNIHTRIADARRAIDSLVKDAADEDGDQREEATQAIQIANRELDELLRQEEIMWKQKSRVTWLREGDRSTKFFHTSTVVRRWRNWIGGIKDENGALVTERAEIGQVFMTNFTNIYRKGCSSFPSGLQGLWSKEVLEGENVVLTAMPSTQKIKEVVLEMNPRKAPGLDGYSGIFFHHY